MWLLQTNMNNYGYIAIQQRHINWVLNSQEIETICENKVLQINPAHAVIDEKMDHIIDIYQHIYYMYLFLDAQLFCVISTKMVYCKSNVII